MACSHTLEQRLLELPADERARIAKLLIESLDPPTDEVEQASIEEAWKIEIDRRIEQIDRGEVDLIPAEEVFARIRGRSSL